MSKLTKKDFDDYLGLESYHTKEDQERFYRNIQPSKGRKSHWLPKTLSAALIIGLFVVGAQFYMGNVPLATSNQEDSISEEKKDWTLWKKAESLQDVDNYYDATIPGLRIARERDQVIEVNQKHPLNDEVSLYIDKAWFHEDKIYLFYSMDLLKDEVVEKNHQTGSIYDFVLYQKDGSTVKLKTESPGPWSGMVLDDTFNNKLYRVTTITLDDDTLDGVDEITTSFTIDAHHDEVTLTDIKLPVQYGDEDITSSSIDESFQSPYSYISFKRFDKSAETGYLFGLIDSELGQEIDILHGNITLANSKKIPLTDRLTVLHDGEFVLDLPELTKENISIDINHLYMIEKERSVDFPIDLSDYVEGKSMDKPMNKLITELELGDNNIFLRNVSYNDFGVTVSFSVSNMTYHKRTQINFDSLVPGLEGTDFPNNLNAVDNNGEKAKEHHFHTINNRGDSDVFTFELTKQFIKDKDYVTVSITNILMEEEFEWSVELPKPD